MGNIITPERVTGARADSYRLGGFGFGPGTNALIMLNRVAFVQTATGKLDDEGKRALVRWACEYQLGQDPELLGAVARRRAFAVRCLAAPERPRGAEPEPGKPRYARLMSAEPEWRLIVGLGNNANPHEVGLALHGTYGCPVIPGSALKGLTAAWANAAAAAGAADPADVRRVFGEAGGLNADGSKSAGQGTVRFLDAIPAGKPLVVAADVLTPHVKPYYDTVPADSGKVPVPPAEYHSPVPVVFLTVRGTYTLGLYGRSEEDIELATRWLAAAGDELGAGAKTAAGYGYLSVKPDEGEAS